MAELTTEQRQAVMHNQGNILISASAGSGKTHTMIERAVRLILDGDIDINQILAVTFTESAAFDMKEKLNQKLLQFKYDLDSGIYPVSESADSCRFCKLKNMVLHGKFGNGVLTEGRAR